MLWPELEPLDRFRAAADVGFRSVEMLFPHELDAQELARVLSQLGLEMVVFDPAAGDWKNGERGLMSLPGREDEFLGTVLAALELAARIGTKHLNILAGTPSASLPPDEVERTLLNNLKRAADLCAREEITVLIENINHVDMPGYRIGTVAEAARIVEAANSHNVRLQLDQYHATMAGEDPIAVLATHLPRVAHVQVADVPGRHQPGTGKAPIIAFLDDLDRAGFDGYVGLEYRPLGATRDSLRWMDRFRLGAD